MKKRIEHNTADRVASYVIVTVVVVFSALIFVAGGSLVMSISSSISASAVSDPATYNVAQGNLVLSQPAYDNSEGGRRIVSVDESSLVAFYYNSSDILYKISTDKGLNWSSERSTGTGRIGSDYLRWTVVSTHYHGMTHIVLLYSNAVQNNTSTKLSAKEGVFFKTTGAIKWKVNPVTLLTVPNPVQCAVNIGGGACTAAVGTTDTQGNIFAAFRWSAGNNGYRYIVYKSTDGGIQWEVSMNSTQAILPTTRGEVSLARLSLGGMIFVYAPYEADEFYYSVYHAGYWSTMKVTTGSELRPGSVKQISSISDDHHFVYLFYVKDGNSGDLRVAKWNNMGVFQGFETIDKTLSHSLPSASVDNNGIVHVFTLANDMVYHIQKMNGNWTPPSNPFGATFDNPDELGSAESIPAAIWREDVDPSDSNYKIEFGFFSS